MELEEFVSGYCRAVDASRTVLLEGSDSDYSADCNYGNCPYEASCPIAKRIRELTEA